MYGVLVEVSPTGRVNMEAVMFEGCPDRYGRYEVMGGSFDRDQIMRKFDREMRRRYERPNFAFDHYFVNMTPEIDKVIFNDPATIVIWKDKTKTVVKCQEGDTYSPELGLAMCIAKKYLGNKGNFNEVFKKWIPEQKSEPETSPEPKISIEEKRQKLQNYCDGKSCLNCPIHSYVHNCGRGLTFIDRDNSDEVSDEEVERSYEIVFRNKEAKNEKV